MSSVITDPTSLLPHKTRGNLRLLTADTPLTIWNAPLFPGSPRRSIGRRVPGLQRSCRWGAYQPDCRRKGLGDLG